MRLNPQLQSLAARQQEKEHREADAVQKLEREVQQLATMIRRFRIEGQRFLAGDLPLPPEELGDRIQAGIRQLRNASIKSTAVNFRLASLESEFNSHSTLLGRRLRKREQGEARRAAEETERLDPVQGVVIRQQGDGEAAEALFHGLNQPKMGLEKFRKYLDRQADVIRTKTGCTDIQFRIAVQDGKLKLKAKPVRG